MRRYAKTAARLFAAAAMLAALSAPAFAQTCREPLSEAQLKALVEKNMCTPLVGDEQPTTCGCFTKRFPVSCSSVNADCVGVEGVDWNRPLMAGKDDKAETIRFSSIKASRDVVTKKSLFPSDPRTSIKPVDVNPATFGFGTDKPVWWKEVYYVYCEPNWTNPGSYAQRISNTVEGKDNWIRGETGREMIVFEQRLGYYIYIDSKTQHEVNEVEWSDKDEKWRRRRAPAVNYMDNK
jgi:hypothetical protein